MVSKDDEYQGMLCRTVTLAFLSRQRKKKKKKISMDFDPQNLGLVKWREINRIELD